KMLARNPSDLSTTSQALAAQEAISQILAHQGDRSAALDVAQQAIARAERISTTEAEKDRKDRALAMAYQNLAEVQSAFEDWKDAHDAPARALAHWQRMQQSGSRRLDLGAVSRTEALLKECETHLR